MHLLLYFPFLSRMWFLAIQLFFTYSVKFCTFFLSITTKDIKTAHNQLLKLISQRYTRYIKDLQFKTFQEMLLHFIKKYFSKIKSLNSRGTKHFWYLKTPPQLWEMPIHYTIKLEGRKKWNVSGKQRNFMSKFMIFCCDGAKTYFFMSMFLYYKSTCVLNLRVSTHLVRTLWQILGKLL